MRDEVLIVFLHFVVAQFRGNLQVIRGFSSQVMSKMCGGHFRRK